MKQARFSLIMIGMLTALLSLALPVWAGPWQVKSGEYSLATGKTLPGDLIFAGDRVEINGVVEGDLVVFAEEVVINGKVTGSVLGFISGRLKDNGTIGGNVRGLINEILVAKTGVIQKSITAMAVKLRSARGSLIGQGILGRFSEADLQGLINGPVSVNTALATKIGGAINGDVELKGAPVKWAPPLNISGTVTDATGFDNNPARTKDIKIAGGYRLRSRSAEEQAGLLKGITILSFIWFLGTLLASLVFYRIFPRTALMITEPSPGALRRNILAGLAGAAGFPLLIIILTVTIVGIPLAILLGLLYLILILFAGIPLNLWMGRLVFKSRLNPVLTTVLGSLILTVIGFIPVVGLLAQPFLWVVGVGMILSNIRWQANQRIITNIQS